MLMLAFFAAAVVAAQPIDTPGGLITEDDYPVAARRAGQEGIAEATLLVDASGYVADCSITTSSGSAELDAATCAILRERSRYVPARDKKGRAIPWTTTRKVRWDLRDVELTSEGVRMHFPIDAAGQIGPCLGEAVGEPDADTTFFCDPALARIMAEAYLKKPVAQYSSLSIDIARDVDPEPAFERNPGDEVKVISAARVRVSADGVVTACTVTDSAPFQGRTLNPCEGDMTVGKKGFTADEAGRARTARVSLELSATPR
jgi:TonB family protein